MTGVTRSLTPMALGSGTKAEFGAELLLMAVVTQGVSAPVAKEVQPEGKAGTEIWSKFSMTEFANPSVKLKGTAPRLVAPSCNCSVATLVEPQAPLAVNVKG